MQCSSGFEYSEVFFDDIEVGFVRCYFIRVLCFCSIDEEECHVYVVLDQVCVNIQDKEIAARFEEEIP